MRSVPQDAAVQLVQRSVDKVTLMIEKDAEQLFKNSEFYSLVRMKKKKCDKNYLNNSFFGNEFYDLYFRAISTKLI